MLTCRLACLSVFLSAYLSAYPPTYLSACLPVYLSAYLFANLSACQQVYVSKVRLSTVNVQHLLEELEALSLGGYVPHLIEAAHVSPAQDDHSQNAEEHEHRLNDVSVHHGLYAALWQGNAGGWLVSIVYI